MSWGETESITALKAEMIRKAQQGTWQSKPSFSVNDKSPWRQTREQPQGQPQAIFQPVCFMMTRVPEIQRVAPASVLSTQHKKPPVEPTPLDRKDKSRSTLPRHMQDDARQSAPRDCAKDFGEQGLTCESFEGELPSFGSKDHFDGSCKRCAFFSKGRCTNGQDCTHCHFAHEPRPRLRKRTSLRPRQAAHTKDATLKDELVEANPKEDSCGSEISTYFTELNPVTDASEWHSQNETGRASLSDSDCATPLAEVVDEDDCGAACIKKFNHAIQEASKAYMSGVQDFKEGQVAKDTEVVSDRFDTDTTPLVSALSDVEDHASCGTSDSEVSSLQESTRSTAPSRDFDSVPSSPISWRAMQRSRKAASLGGGTTADIKRMVRPLLNKLTAERFESLCKQVLALPLSTPEHLAVVAAEIFAKATTQDCFRTLYTDLCIRLDAHLAAQTSDIGGKAFRRALANACQATFEHHFEPADAALFVDLSDEESFEVHMKLKTRRLGNMRFIGDLLIRRLLAPKLLPQIVHKLLSGNEDALESLIALILVVAREFEEKASPYQAPLRDAFQVLRHKLNNKSVCSRLCCQINDLFDSKARGWASRSVCA